MFMILKTAMYHHRDKGTVHQEERRMKIQISWTIFTIYSNLRNDTYLFNSMICIIDIYIYIYVTTQTKVFSRHLEGIKASRAAHSSIF